MNKQQITLAHKQYNKCTFDNLPDCFTQFVIKTRETKDTVCDNVDFVRETITDNILTKKSFQQDKIRAKCNDPVSLAKLNEGNLSGTKISDIMPTMCIKQRYRKGGRFRPNTKIFDDFNKRCSVVP